MVGVLFWRFNDVQPEHHLPRDHGGSPASDGPILMSRQGCDTLSAVCLMGHGMLLLGCPGTTVRSD